MIGGLGCDSNQEILSFRFVRAMRICVQGKAQDGLETALFLMRLGFLTSKLRSASSSSSSLPSSPFPPPPSPLPLRVPLFMVGSLVVRPHALSVVKGVLLGPGVF